MKLEALAFNIIKKEILAQVVCGEFCKISKTHFLKEHLLWLLLYVSAIKHPY